MFIIIINYKFYGLCLELTIPCKDIKCLNAYYLVLLLHQLP